MGSGAGGVYSRTRGSAAGEQSRDQILAAVELAAGMLLGESVVELAEALLRVAAGEPIEDVDFPDVGDVAFDLALDALSAFIPGGAAATRSLGAAARAAGKVGKVSGKKAAGKAAEEIFGPAYPGIMAELPKGEAQLKHIFRDDHNWKDTPENRKRLTELVSRPQNFFGKDERVGKAWYLHPKDDLPQLWASVVNDAVSNAGVNVERQAIWDPVEGFNRNPKANDSWRGKKKGKRK